MTSYTSFFVVISRIWLFSIKKINTIQFFIESDGLPKKVKGGEKLIFQAALKLHTLSMSHCLHF